MKKEFGINRCSWQGLDQSHGDRGRGDLHYCNAGACLVQNAKSGADDRAWYFFTFGHCRYISFDPGNKRSEPGIAVESPSSQQWCSEEPERYIKCHEPGE